MPTTDSTKVKALLRDPDALLLLALVVVYLLLPAGLLEQVKTRLDDPIALTLLSIATGGRFAVRAAGAVGLGMMAPELVRHGVVASPPPASAYPGGTDPAEAPEPAGVTFAKQPSGGA